MRYGLSIITPVIQYLEILAFYLHLSLVSFAFISLVIFYGAYLIINFYVSNACVFQYKQKVINDLVFIRWRFFCVAPKDMSNSMYIFISTLSFRCFSSLTVGMIAFLGWLRFSGLSFNCHINWDDKRKVWISKKLTSTAPTKAFCTCYCLLYPSEEEWKWNGTGRNQWNTESRKRPKTNRH